MNGRNSPFMWKYIHWKEEFCPFMGTRKFRRNLREIEKKIWTDSRKIMETLLGKAEVIRNWYWYYEEILENFFEVISVKSKKKNTKKANKN